MKTQIGIFWTFFFVVAVMIMAVWGTLFYVGYKIATDPGVIGRSAGSIVKEFKEHSK